MDKTLYLEAKGISAMLEKFCSRSNMSGKNKNLKTSEIIFEILQVKSNKKNFSLNSCQSI